MDDKVKELLDRIRDTAAGAADAANQTARAAGKRAGQMVDVAKLNVQLFDLNGEFNDILRQMGQVMYDAHRGQREEGDKVSELLERLTAWEGPAPVGRVLALHASQRSTSNTLALWEMVRRSLPPEVQVQEICLRNGTMADCIGCSYTACMHFGEQGGCFYGGPMVEEVYPAVRSCDTLVMVCANYNDALSANLTACVNRLTALFRQTRFYDKRLYGLVVSGYSGGDLVARQLLGAMCLNKTVSLPPRFCLLETANDLPTAQALPGIAGRLDAFAAAMQRSLCQPAGNSSEISPNE